MTGHGAFETDVAQKEVESVRDGRQEHSTDGYTSAPFGGGRNSSLLALQRSVGNQVVARSLAPKPRPRSPNVQRAPAQSAVHRTLDPDKEQQWADVNGDKIISAIEGVVGQWKSFRSSPASFDAIKSIGSPRPLVTLLEENPQFRQHIAEKLRASVAYLQEMAGFLPTWRLLVDLVPGLTWKDPKHDYKMTANSSATINKVGYLPVQQFTIKYSNAYGWAWSRDVVTTGIQWSISIAAQAGIAGPNIPDAAGGKDDVKKKLKPGASVSIPGKADKPGKVGPNPMIPEFAEFNITNAAVAKPVKYWGFNDMNGGGAIVNGPSASLKLGFAGGKTAATGGMLKLHGSNGDLDFTEFKSDISGSIKPGMPGSMKDAMNLEAKATLASVGVVGMKAVGEASGVTAPEVKKMAKAQTRTFGYTLQAFPVEAAERDIPADMLGSMESELSQLEDRVLEDADGLSELGITQEFLVKFTSEGFASRGWAGAVNDATRKQKNVELSQKRADYVSSKLMDKFGALGESFWAVGRGPALYAAMSDKGPRAADVVGEDDTEGINRLVEKHRLKWLDDTMRQEASTQFDGVKGTTPYDRLLVMSHEEALRFRESLMKSNPETSTAPGAQRVNITITWSGHLLEYGTETVAP